MKKQLAAIAAFLLILTLNTAAVGPVLASDDPGAAQSVAAEGTGQPGAGEAEQWDLTQDLNYRFEEDIVLLQSEAVSIRAERLKYEDTDEGRALSLVLGFTNLTDAELELEMHSLAGRVPNTWGRGLDAGSTIKKAAAGRDYNWNGLIGETADCYQGTYVLTVMLGGEVTDTVHFDLYISKTAPFFNISAEGGAAVPEEARSPYIEETVLADEDLFKITANRLEGSTLYVTFENKSDRNLEFTSVETDGLVNTVNGYANDSGTHEEIAPGESVESDIGFGGGVELGVEKIADIQHGFEVRDADSYELIARVPVHLQTSAADYDYSGESFGKALQDPAWMEKKKWTLNWFTDQVDYDCAGIRILSAALITRNESEPELYLELENATDENRYFYADAVAVNGLYLPGSIDSALVPAGKKAVSSQNRVYDLADETEAALFGLEQVSSLTVIGITTTDVTDHTINTSEPLGSQSFTLLFGDSSDTGVHYEALENLLDEDGIRLDKVSELTENEEGIRQYFAITNSSGGDIRVTMNYEGNQVNGQEARIFWMSPNVVPDGETGVNVLQLDEDVLAECGIGSAAEITDLEVQLMITRTDGSVLEKTIQLKS